MGRKHVVPKDVPAQSAIKLEELEPRILFSGGIESVLAGDAMANAVHQTIDDDVEHIDSSSQELNASDNQNDGQSHELVFVDTQVEDYQTLLNDIMAQSDEDRQIEIVVLDSQRNGIQQITESLSQYDSLSAIHLISHGSEGSLQVGSSDIDQFTLESNTNAISSWQNSLTENADILLYGCDLAGDEAGENFVNTLADLTGADVAASVDLTGAAEKGGDWDLEYQRGDVEAAISFSTTLQQNWTGTLATSLTVDTTADNNDSGIVDGNLSHDINWLNANLGADGKISLREAIAATNNTTNGGSPDTINFNITDALVGGLHTINIGAGGLPTISDAVIIDGSTDADFSGTPIIKLDGGSAGSNGITLTGTSDGSEIRGLMINDFSGYGIHIQSGAANITIAGNWIGSDGTGDSNQGNTNNGIQVQGINAIIGGTGLYDSNVINNNGNEGINITSSATGTMIQGNIIGLEADGTTGGGNLDVGIAVFSDGNTIGGTTVAARNIISMNYEGIEINTSNNIVQGNYIGTDVTGTLDRGNRSDDGVEVQAGTNNLIGGDVVGAGNLIAFNQNDGIYLVGGTGTSVLGNIIHSNNQQGIDLGSSGITNNDAGDGDTGANNLQNFPVLTGAVTDTTSTITIAGTLDTDGLSQDYRIEFFASTTQDGLNHGEAERYLGYVIATTNGSGDATFNAVLSATVAFNEYITATATVDNGGGSYGDTSEFGLNIQAELDDDTVTVVNQSITVAEGALNTVLTLSELQSTDVDTADATLIYTVGNVTNGSLSINGSFWASGSNDTFTQQDIIDGNVLYTHDGSETSSDSFSYTVEDPIGNQLTGQTFSITVTPVNDDPVATQDPGAYSSDLLALNPLSYWRLGETSGAAADLGSSANNGSYNGGTLNQSGGISGDNNTAVSFDGASDYVDFAHSDDYLLDNGTIQLWFNANTAASGDLQHLFSKDSNGNDTGGHVSIYLTAAGNLEVRMQSTASSYVITSGSAVSQGDWHHVAFSFGDEGMALYLDGESVDTDSYTGGMGTTSGGIGNYEQIAIGGGTQNSGNLVITPVNQFMGGLIDEVAIIGSQVSAETIQLLYSAGVQNYTLSEDSTLSIPASEGVLINDYDTENDTLTVTELNGNAADIGLPTTLASGAQVTLNSDGSFFYDPNGQFEYLDVGESTTDTFSYTLSDGNGGTDTATVTVTINGAEDAPVIANAAADQTATEDAAFSFTFASNTFNDVDSSDTLIYTSTLADDSPLPSWLNFDGSTRTYSGTPTNADVAVINLKLIADDGSSTVVDTFSITVNNTNDAPTVANVIADQVATEDSAFSLQFAANTFNDLDGDSLTYTSDASGWLSFDAATRTFSGTPLNADVGTTTVIVTASDGNGGSVSDTFDIVISNTNDAPTVANLVPDQVATEDSAFSLLFAANTFNDLDGDSLTYTSDASGWLSFDAATRTFSGTPLNADVGTTTVTVTANDGNGGAISDTFDIVISNTNDAPTVANLISDQVATEDSAFSFQFAANTFNDLDGDSLTYTSDASGWLSFDDSTRTFSGTPLNADVGTTTVTVTANDGNGGSISDTFDIVISNTNDAPAVANLVPDQVATEDSAFSLQFAANTFNDLDGDSLTYTSDASGWLSFDDSTRTFSGTPLNADVGTTTVIVTANDGNGGTISESFDIVISNTNDAPVASPDYYDTDEDSILISTLENDLLENDSDIDRDSLTINTEAVLNPSHGSVILNSDGTFTYTPNQDFHGTDEFVYEISDSEGGTAIATVSIDVQGVNDAPQVSNDLSFEIQGLTENGNVLGQFIANDVDNDAFNYQIIAGDGNNTFAIDAEGRVIVSNASQIDQSVSNEINVIIQVTDGQGGSVQASMKIFWDGLPTSSVSEEVPESNHEESDEDFNSREQVLETQVEPEEMGIQSDEIDISPELSIESDFEEPQEHTFSEQVEAATNQYDYTQTEQIYDHSAPDKQIRSVSSSHYETLLISKFEALEANASLLQIQNLFESTAPYEFESLLANHTELWQQIDSMTEQMEDPEEFGLSGSAKHIEVTASVTGSIAAGFVSWLLRGGSLLASTMSAAPLWRQFDPMPVLSQTPSGKKKASGNGDQKNDSGDESVVNKFFEQ